MNKERKTNLRVGIVGVLAFILMIWIFGWAKNFNLSSDSLKLHIRFDSVAGLEEGDVVSINGVRKGFVETIRIKDDGVYVIAVLDNDTKLKADASFSVVMLDLMGGKKVEIDQGTSETLLDLKDIHNGKFGGDISAAITALSSVQTDIIDIVKEVKTSLSAINRIISDSSIAEKLSVSLSKLNSALDETRNLIRNNKDDLNTLLTSTTSMTENVNKFLTKNDEVINENLKNLDILMKNTNQITDKIKTMIEEIQGKRNNLGKIIYDDEMLTKLQTTLDNFNELAKQINSQLKGDGIKVDADIF